MQKSLALSGKKNLRKISTKWQKHTDSAKPKSILPSSTTLSKSAACSALSRMVSAKDLRLASNLSGGKFK